MSLQATDRQGLNPNLLYSSEYLETSGAKFCLALKHLGAVLLFLLNNLSAAAAFTAQDECNKVQVADAHKYLVFCGKQSPGFVYPDAKTSVYNFYT